MRCTINYTPIGETEPIEFEESEFVAFLAAGEYEKILAANTDLDLPPIPPMFKGQTLTEDETQDLVDDVIASKPSKIGGNLKAFIFAMNNAEGVSAAQKKAMNEQLGEYYETLSDEQLIALGKDIVEAEEGLDKAIIKADNSTDSEMPPYLKLFIYGEASIRSVQQQKEAKTDRERNRLADGNNIYIDKIDNLLRNAGRAIQFVKHLYRRSPLAVARTVYNIVKERNEVNAPQAEETVKGVVDILKETDDVENSVKEVLEQQLNDTSKELEKAKSELEKLKNKLSSGTKPTGSKVDLGVGKDRKKELQDKLKNKKYNAAQNDIMPISVQEMNDLTEYVEGQLEEGFESFEDVFDKVNKDLGGEYSDYYRDAYKKARDLAVEKGSKNKYSTDEEIDTVADTKKAESDADKLVKASEKAAKAEKDRVKKEGEAHKIAAKRIVGDAKSMSGLPTTKKEADLLNQLISKVAAKAKDTMANKSLSPTQKTPLELITFALENAKKGKEIFNEAKKEVNTIIDNDKKLTKEQKEDLKKFLENYQKSIFDNLLSSKDKNNILKTALIEAGYAKEVNGKVVLNLDPLAFEGANIDEAIKKIQNQILSKTNYTESEIKDLMDSLKEKLEANIAERKAAKVLSFIKSRNRVGKSGRKLRIDKLVELYRAGGMSNKEVLNHLAKDLGIVAFDATEQAYVEDLVTKIDKAQIGNERTILEEELQAFFEYKEGTFALNAFFDSLRANLLSSPITAIKNISGVGQTISDFLYASITTALKDLPKGNVDVNLFKVLRTALRTANETSLNIMLSGGADTGSAFAEITGQKEGVPSVRRLESKFVPYRKFLIPKAAILNKKLYLIGRILNAPDSYNHIIQADVESYMLIKDRLLKNDPNLTRKEAAKQALELVYASDLTDARKQATKEFEDRGITFNLSKKADRARYNRRVSEILQQARPTDIIDKANAQASRGTYKQADIGAFSLLGRGMQNMINSMIKVSATLRQKGRGTPQAALYNKMANIIDIVLKSAQSAFFPIVTGAANILEKGAELELHYGLLKSIGYSSAAIATNYNARNLSAEDKILASEKASELFEKSRRYAFRSLILGQLYMLAILSMIDKDDEDKDEEGKARPKLYGTGEVNRNKNVIIKEIRPSNTMVINEKNIPIELLGGMFLALKLKALELDIDRYLSDEKIDAKKRAKLTLEAVTSSSTLKGANDLYKYLSDPTSPSAQNFLMKRLAELTTRTTIPFTSFSRAAEQIREPKAKQAITFGENILRYSGIVGGWALDRKSYDVLGNEYDTKDLYTSGAGGTVNILSKPIQKPLLLWVNKATGSNATVSSVNTKQSAYLVPNPKTGELEAMSDLQYYEFGLIKSKIFGELLNSYYDKFHNREINKETEKIAKDDIGNLNEVAKKIAYSVMFKGVNQEQLIKENEKVFYENNEDKTVSNEEQKALFKEYNATEQDIKLFDMKGKNWISFKYDDLIPALNKVKDKETQIQDWASMNIINQKQKSDLKEYFGLD